MKKRKKGQKKKIKIKFLNILLFLIILLIILYFIYSITNLKITNIYISGNKYLSDNDIIKLAKIKNYPKTFYNTSKIIEKRIEKSNFIISAKVNKKYFTKIYIKIEENYPIFYNSLTLKTILKNGNYINESLDTSKLLNKVPNKKYNKLIKKINDVNYNVLSLISEIKYNPDTVDDERFLLTMTDGNYVYITLSKFDELNNYLSYIKEFNNKKGILYLNSGEYFKIMEN